MACHGTPGARAPGPHQGMPGTGLRLGVPGHLQEPLAAMVLHEDLRKCLQGSALSRPPEIPLSPLDVFSPATLAIDSKLVYYYLTVLPMRDRSMWTRTH